jgi:hypothetical protein
MSYAACAVLRVEGVPDLRHSRRAMLLMILLMLLLLVVCVQGIPNVRPSRPARLGPGAEQGEGAVCSSSSHCLGKPGGSPSLTTKCA